MTGRNWHYSAVVVEDEPLLQKYIAHKIEQACDRFRVVGTALDGESALEVIEEQLPDLVVSDIKMPQMDGIQLAERMQNRFPQTVLVLLSGYADFEYAQKAVRFGVYEYMLKPLRSDELSSLLNRMAARFDQAGEESGALAGASPRQIYEVLRDHLHEHYAEKIDLQSLSETFGYSPAYLTKLFHRYADITPLRFLTDLRIHAAAQLLRSTEIPVAEVGARVGYPDPFYFSRVFKRSRGVSPQTYRGSEDGTARE